MNENYIITSTSSKSDDNEISATKIFLFDKGNKLVKYIKNSNQNTIFLLLPWYNKQNDKYYILQFAYKKITINNLLEEELYAEFINEPENNHLSGFIYQKNNCDYLCSSSYNGHINIWDLYHKKIVKIFKIEGCKLIHIIEWNKKFIITADYNNRLIKIIDIENEYSITTNINSGHNKNLLSIKKINHPIYGESLLSVAEDMIIKLWTIE